MSYYETGDSKVSSMKEVRAILYEYRVEDIQVPYLLAECVDYLMAERDRLREVLEDISAEGRHARSGSTGYRMAVIARKALQEDRNG